MIDEERGTCMCGHEIDVNTGLCMVWTETEYHLVDQDSEVCTCHGLDISKWLWKQW